MSQRRVLFIAGITALFVSAGVRLSAQDAPKQDPPFQIQVDVAGRAINDAEAARKKKKTEWIELHSRNFIVAGDANLDDLRLAASEAELFRDRFAQMFPRAKKTSSVPTRIIVFRDRKSIKQFGPLDEDRAASDRPFFQQNPDFNYLVLTSGDHLSHDIIRGLVREFARDSINPVPLWFQEALGEYFSSFQIGRLGDDRVIKMGLDDYKQKLTNKNLIPLSFLFTASTADFTAMNSDTKKFFTAESCSLFEYLLQNRRITATLKMINAMADGRTVAESFRDAFKLPIPTFEENYRRHIQSSKLRGWNVTFTALSLDPRKRLLSISYADNPAPLKLPANFDTIAAAVEVLPVSLLTEAQTETYRGDLLFHSGRLNEAESHLRNALALDDKEAAAYASLGAVKSIQHEYAAAQSFIDLAVKMDPGNYLPYYYAALLLRRGAMESGVDLSDDELAEMRAELTRSVNISPEFVETSEMLAETQRLSHGDLNASTRLLLDGLKRAPGRESLLMEMAKIAIDGNQKPVAGWMLQRLVFSGSADTGMKEEARVLLNQLNLTPEQRAEFGGITAGDSGNDNPQGFSVRLISKSDRKDLVKTERDEIPGKVVRGYIAKVDCAKGMTIYFHVGIQGVGNDRLEKLHTDTPERVDWVSDEGQPIDIIACGETRVGRRVLTTRAVITYKPKTSGSVMGEPLVVEIVHASE